MSKYMYMHVDIIMYTELYSVVMQTYRMNKLNTTFLFCGRLLRVLLHTDGG